MDIRDLGRELADVRKEAKELLDKPEKSEEDYIKVNELLERGEKIQGDIEMYERLNGIKLPEIPEDNPIKSGPTDKPETKGFDSFGEFLQSVARSSMPGERVDSRLGVPRDVEMREPTGLGEAGPSLGGFLVQKDFAAELWRRTYDTGLLPGRCRRVPISGPSNGLKMNAIDETSRATGSRLGGIRVYRANEAGTVTAAKPKFRQISLDLEKLMGICYATDEILNDASALESIVMQGFAEEFGFRLDDEIIRGTGAGQCLGILNADCKVSVSAETGQAADTILTENIIKMRSRMWSRSRANAVWLINQECEPQLYTMSLAVGTGGIPVYMPANGLADSPYDRLMGLPVIPIEQCAQLGDEGDIILADLSQYLLIDKGGIRSDSSIHVQFLYDEMIFRFIVRNNGMPLWDSALTPYKATSGNTLSPFVTLAARA